MNLRLSKSSETYPCKVGREIFGEYRDDAEPKRRKSGGGQSSLLMESPPVVPHPTSLGQKTSQEQVRSGREPVDRAYRPTQDVVVKDGIKFREVVNLIQSSMGAGFFKIAWLDELRPRDRDIPRPFRYGWFSKL